MAWHRDNISTLRITFAEIVRVLKPLEGVKPNLEGIFDFGLS